MISSSKYKSIVIIAIALILIFTLFGGNTPEDVAKEYLEATFDGNAKKCISLMSDDLISNMNVATEKLAISKMQDALDNAIKDYKDKYGKKWKYDVEIIDSYEEEGVTKVAYKVTHKGKGFFNKKEANEKGTLKLVKSGRKWYINSL